MNYKDEFMDVQRREATDVGLFGSERLNNATTATARIFNGADAKRKWQCKVRQMFSDSLLIKIRNRFHYGGVKIFLNKQSFS